MKIANTPSHSFLFRKVKISLNGYDGQPFGQLMTGSPHGDYVFVFHDTVKGCRICRKFRKKHDNVYEQKISPCLDNKIVTQENACVVAGRVVVPLSSLILT